ncbi:cation:dicarboxylate symporter family transporter [Candidatus Finniella inopinata]|uniref:Cation:dicarboxylase symporter family transporter n=1 Tax=Candidatus Finniella inopinata TaxID=1696036 RepID=A0A4Q7DL04_9PROT|nr:cation:dicarboxylase symporter family transporter [Candidatus Finniella inopinata]RZI47019.1 cation:dicarboxylase symporter family transporter [Candidatus Finniella inopinata]
MSVLLIVKNLVLKNLPVQLLLCLIGGLLFGDFLSNHTVSLFYTASLLIKELLMFALPIIIFSYLLAALASFDKQGPFLIVAILGLVILSNAVSVLTAFGVSHLVFPWLGGLSSQGLTAVNQSVHPVWSLGLSPFLSPDRALLAGIVAGLLVNFIPSASLKHQAKSWAFQLRDWTTVGLKKGFIPFLPVYVLGFVLKLDREGSLGVLIQSYGKIFVLGCLLIIFYLLFLYGLAAGFRKDLWVRYVREMLPAGLTGFSTMSSAATMPVTLEATEKNLNDRSYADFVIPVTVNIHLVGDGLSISLTALALLIMSGHPFPDIATYLTFTFYYCLAKFSCAGIPGGGVIVILPVIQAYLGLSPEMTTLLATIYILQDPILTGANVMGNGAFALLTRRILNPLYNRPMEK